MLLSVILSAPMSLLEHKYVCICIQIWNCSKQVNLSWFGLAFADQPQLLAVLPICPKTSCCPNHSDPTAKRVYCLSCRCEVSVSCGKCWHLAKARKIHQHRGSEKTESQWLCEWTKCMLSRLHEQGNKWADGRISKKWTHSLYNVPQTINWVWTD